VSSEDNADYLLKQARNHGITNPQELVNFMGQMQVESGGFTRMNENLNYSGHRLLEVFPGRNGMHTLEQADAISADGPEAIANKIYGGTWGKLNLGNTESGDGWTYHGRGYVQLTGRDNYDRVGREMGLNLVDHPELAADRETAARIALHYWDTRVVPKGHQTDVAAACADINGGHNGLQARKDATEAWREKLGHQRAPERRVTTEDRRCTQATRTLQHDLEALGYTGVHGRRLKPDGNYGPNTRHAVEAFQHEHHLKVDGIAGARTREALDQAIRTHQHQPQLNDENHPGYPLYLEAQRAVYALDRNMGRTSDAQSDQLAGAAAVAAQKAGLKHITEIVLSEDGVRAFAVERRGAPTFAYVQTAEAVNTTLAQSGAAWMQHAAQQAREAQAPAPVKAPAHDGPTMSI